MTAVDVLAVLADEARRDPEFISVHDAVAELVEKARAVCAHGDDRTLIVAIKELRAALARVGGAA